MSGDGSAQNGTRNGDSRGFTVWIAVGLLVGWMLLGNVGPMFDLAPGVRAWYPPAALLAAALTYWGAPALAPVILAASVIAVASPSSPVPLWRILLVSALLKVIYWTGAKVLRRFGFDPGFSRTVDVALFASVFAATAAVAAFVAVIDLRSSIALSNPDILLLMRSFWIGDVVAVFSLAPAMLVVAPWLTPAGRKGRRLPTIRFTRRDIAQLVSIPVAIACAAALAPSLGFFSYALCFLPLGWIALTHGPRFAALANVLFVLGALYSVRDITGGAPKSLEVQAFTALLVLTGLMLGSVADERERAFGLLGQSEGRYRSLVELLPDPLVVHEEGRIVFANGAAARVIGAPSPDVLCGHKLVDLAAPQSKELMEERMQSLAAGKAVPLARHTLICLDGSGTVEVESVSIPFAYQGRAAALTVARDVTARVRLEEDLRQAQRMEAVGRLAGGVAHDFNNLLTVITSYSQLILAGLPAGAPLADDVREIRHAADRAAALTRQLLSFSRRQVLQPLPLDLSEAVQNTEALLRRLITSEIQIVSHLDPEAGLILADRGQLEQVIVNLAVNARDAMPDGGTLTIETRRVSSDDEPAAARCSKQTPYYALIVVRDTGSGIDDATRRQMFDPFFTTKEIGHGTGLGLATVHGIVEQAGGTIVVDSVLGSGTTFRIVLPSLEEHAGSVAPAVAVPDFAPGQGQVLLVEDEDAVRESIRRTLVDAGYGVIQAIDGLEALGVLEMRASDVDVILSDVAMPRMDGRQLADHIRVRWPSLPVVMMSGFADPDTVGADAGVTLMLLKPFTAETLTSAIRDSLPAR
jgi:two-component system, cell cycle sensor histidine kinase and response regulator CckA